jgi:hypothetical protein
LRQRLQIRRFHWKNIPPLPLAGEGRGEGGKTGDWLGYYPLTLALFPRGEGTNGIFMARNHLKASDQSLCIHQSSPSFSPRSERFCRGSLRKSKRQIHPPGAVEAQPELLGVAPDQVVDDRPVVQRQGDDGRDHRIYP